MSFVSLEKAQFKPNAKGKEYMYIILAEHSCHYQSSIVMVV